MARVFHEIEKKIIGVLRQGGSLDEIRLSSETGLSPDQIRRGTEWLRLKGIVDVKKSRRELVSLGKNGLDALERGLPERRLLDMLREGPKPADMLQKELGGLFGPAMGIAKRNGWVSAGADGLEIASLPENLPGEALLRRISRSSLSSSVLDSKDLAELRARPDYIMMRITKSRSVTLLDAQLKDEGGKGIDVEAGVLAAQVARAHPLSQTISEIREIFVTLGFTEVYGNHIQPCFWNFDALFTPQDHPAREMHDTFYVDGMAAKFAAPDQMRNVASSHEKNWKRPWSAAAARRQVLRTHTTCVTIKHLAECRPEEAMVFSMGRVFRNEKASYKHLAEFHQIEGVVTGKGATLRELMGLQSEFYRRLGLGKVKFWPTFFPYTEPSLQAMIYNERLEKWVEMFGMGIFRPEVTGPLGIRGPVLAWGGGIERIAMIKYGIDDVREFYNNDLKWLRRNI